MSPILFDKMVLGLFNRPMVSVILRRTDEGQSEAERLKARINYLEWKIKKLKKEEEEEIQRIKCNEEESQKKKKRRASKKRKPNKKCETVLTGRSTEKEAFLSGIINLSGKMDKRELEVEEERKEDIGETVKREMIRENSKLNCSMKERGQEFNTQMYQEDDWTGSCIKKHVSYFLPNEDDNESGDRGRELEGYLTVHCDNCGSLSVGRILESKRSEAEII